VFLSLRNLIYGAALSLALAGFSSASTITATFNGVSKSTSVSVSTNSGISGSWSTATVGLSTFTQTGGTFGLDPLAPGTSILAFCIQLEQSISSGSSVTFDVVDLKDGRNPAPTLGATKAAQIDQLFNIAFSSNAGLVSTSISNLVAQAVQIAIWEIIYETSGTFNVTNGTTRFKDMSTSLRDQANSYLSLITANPTPTLDLFAMNNRYKQDFVIQVNNPGDTGQVPEPGTMLLTATALLGLSLRLRRRKQSAGSVE
jgi:hypothetical protein